MTTAQDGVQTGEDPAAADRRADLLEYLYPAYRVLVRVDRHGQVCWWAIRRHLTAELRAEGILQSVVRPSGEALQDALAGQDLLMHLRRGRV